MYLNILEYMLPGLHSTISLPHSLTHWFDVKFQHVDDTRRVHGRTEISCVFLSGF